MVQAKYKKWLEKDNLIKLRSWARDGLTDEQISHNMGINVSTLYTWKNKYSELKEALKKGKEVVDAEIEESLISTMMKHTITTVTYKMVKKDKLVLQGERQEFINRYKLDHPEATEQEILIETAKNVEVYEQIPQIKNVTEVDPNISAIIFWLKSREPNKFRDQTFRKLNEANARKVLADAKISEQQLKELTDQDAPQTNTIVIDDFNNKENNSNSTTDSVETDLNNKEAGKDDNSKN